MGHGTEISVYAPRIHKHNAGEIRESAEEMIQYYRDTLLILCASTPRDLTDESGHIMHWEEYIWMQMEEISGELREAVVRSFLASRIEESPEDCIDDLEEYQ